MPHKDALGMIKRADEPIANELARELHRIDPDLTFEFSVGKSEHEFIVSAGGIKSAFPSVKRVVAAAPAIPGWKIIAFRQRKTGGTIEMGDGTKLGRDSLTFRVLRSSAGKVDIVLYVKGAPALSNSVKEATYLLLDNELGEYDVETRLGEIEIEPAPKVTPPGVRPFGELVNVVDKLK